MQYLRKVQGHGTGKEIRLPPGVCGLLGITRRDDVCFTLEPDFGVVTLRKAGQLYRGNAKQYFRRVQQHGFGKEVRLPPEVCGKLEIAGGDSLRFVLGPDADMVTLRKAGFRQRCRNLFRSVRKADNLRRPCAATETRVASGPDDERVTSGPDDKREPDVRSYLWGLVTVQYVDDSDGVKDEPADDSGPTVGMRFDDD